ncbi:hypothetical protein Vretifemale_495 [Volvox reticuliferus]|uniref:Uncharacterized protein n=2 Tax=Volvox reticuliferus TaxID=1737510 RepID=A0A8J4BWL2_9CHLO|nr:hypothetical protein Vretifemale_495 [Volvox reticuliferus]
MMFTTGTASRYAVTAWFHKPPPQPLGSQGAAENEPAAAPLLQPLAPLLPPCPVLPNTEGAPPGASRGISIPGASLPRVAADSVKAVEGRMADIAAADADGYLALQAAASAPIDTGAGNIAIAATRPAPAPAPAPDTLGVATEGGACGRTDSVCAGAEDAAAATVGARIFVSMAAYRDPEGPWTLHSLFSKADHPERVRVGVVWQIDPVKEATFVGVAGALRHPEWLRQVSQVVVPYQDAAGPCTARALTQTLWSGEEYILQIDSHMRMVPGWDTACIQQLAAAEAMSLTGKAVLSTYPLGYSGAGPAATSPDDTSAPTTLLCAKGFDQDGFLRTVGRVLRKRPAAPLLTHFWAAGLTFTRSEWLREVPYCPYLPHLFFGEESYMLARMWTRGWDVFAPAVPLAFHQWERSARAHTYQRDKMGEAAKGQQQQPRQQPEPQGEKQGAEQELEVGQGRALEEGATDGAWTAGTLSSRAANVPTTACCAAQGTDTTIAATVDVTPTAAAITAVRKRSQAQVLRVLSSDAVDAAAVRAREPSDARHSLQTCDMLHAAVLAQGSSGHDGDTREEGDSDAWGLGQVWGLGTLRTLDQLAAASGVDYAAKTVSARAQWGGLPQDAFEM